MQRAQRNPSFIKKEENFRIFCQNGDVCTLIGQTIIVEKAICAPREEEERERVREGDEAG